MDKIFCGSGKEIETKFGKMLKLSFSEKDIQTLIDSKNEKGWVNCVVKAKRDPEEGKSTHYLEIDTWEPKSQTPKTYRDMAQKKVEESFGVDVSDLPF